MINVRLKWNKNTYEKVPLNIEAGVSFFKDTIYQLTGVPHDRQKLTTKGIWIGTLKDSADFSSMKLEEGMLVTLIGTADVIQAPKEAVKFIEDLTVEQLTEKGVATPAGIINMGNTCYLNSTVECFRYMPELRKELANVGQINANSGTLLRDALDELDKTGKVNPFFTFFLINLRNNFPQFAETNQHGYLQQDAEEFFNTIANVFKSLLDRNGSNKFNSLLGIQLQETMSCEESEAEPTITTYDYVDKLICNIQGGIASTTTVDHMKDGLKLGLEGTIVKHSNVLNRDALWKKRQKISRLPKYLCVQFLRFFWKETPDSRDHRGVKCKILRAVSFPETLDILDFCNDSLRSKILANRRNVDVQSGKGTSSTTTVEDKIVSMDVVDSTQTKIISDDQPAISNDMDMDDENALQEAMKLSVGQSTVFDSIPPTTSSSMNPIKAVSHPTSSEGKDNFEDGLPETFSGYYELHSVVTHKGRSADSGHYIGWVRQDPGSDYWWCFDDDKVSEKKTEDVLNLRGGGDWHTAYLNFYRFKQT